MLDTKKIKELREALGWTQRKLSIECGITIGTISKIENGYHTVTNDTTEKLANALHVKPAELLKG